MSWLGRRKEYPPDPTSAATPGPAVQQALATLSTAHNELTGLLDDLRTDLVDGEQWDLNSRNALLEATRTWDQSISRQRDLILTMPMLLTPTALPPGQKPRNLLS